MTIALGILSTDGVVIAADSQMTVPGYLKVNHGKVSCSLCQIPNVGISAFIVSGAGSETSLAYLSKSLTSGLSDKNLTNSAQVEAELKEQIRDYHERHVTPHGVGGSLDAWMIVGAMTGRQKCLWVTDKSVCVEESMFGAVGAGAMYAKSLLGKMYAPTNTLGAILLASYVISEVKQLIDGCGNDTDIVGFGRDKFYYVHRDNTRALEQLFQQRYSHMEARVLHEMLGNMGWRTQTKLSKESTEIKKELLRIVAKIESPESSIQGKRARRSRISQT